MEPYRRQLVGLPLQQSLFRDIGRVADVLGCPDALPSGRARIWLDDDGNLFLNREDCQRLASTLQARLTVETLDAMECMHRAACASVHEATTQAAEFAEMLDELAARSLLKALASRIAHVIGYGILAKFVPDAFARALTTLGDEASLPFPNPSAGLQLTRGLLALHDQCKELGYRPKQLELEWPAVPTDAKVLVLDFCRRQTGFGPLPWDSPGYEDPRYALAALRAAFSDVDPEEMRRKLAGAGRPVSTPGSDSSCLVSAVRRVLGFWLEFLEYETWHVRRAFFLGMAPLLRRLAAGQSKRPEFRIDDLLFLGIEDVVSGRLDQTAIEERRRKYLGDARYLARHAIKPGRLTAILAT